MTLTTNKLIGVELEGNLIAPDLTIDLLAGEIKGQALEDFNLPKTNKLLDEIARAWDDAKIYWTAFQRALGRLNDEDPATKVTREQWVVPLLRSLGYDPVYTAKAEIVDGQTYALSHRADEGDNKPPIHIIGSRIKLDKRPPSGTPRLSAHALMQEYLNRTEHLWGIVTNGLQWRLLRDSELMTRLCYIEFDLEQILNGGNFAEFALFYRLFHRSRLPQGLEDADKCWLEFYHQETIQQGGRVRDKLRDGVEKALKFLGDGLLQHPANQQLRERFDSGKLSDKEFYRQLLMLIYRLLFLMVAESRDLLLTDEDVEKTRIYLEYYSVTRLRNLAERPSYRREGFQDLWQGLRITFLLFDENWRGQALGLSPLNGDLFGSKSLEYLDWLAIDNHDLLKAIRELSLYEQKGQLRRVNYKALDVEELGSIYESLLDFHPQIQQKQGKYQFNLVTGSDRKTTGSYYTPPELVGQLIKSALEPVIADQLKTAKTPEEKEKALLELKVCDPACGSGHFLLAAARRIGKELARVRTFEAQPGIEPLRKAIRDVIQNCIYGVDINPLAVDLCKVALWIEGFNRNFPLNFLDHRIKCGNSLVGVRNLDCLKDGIPDAAFKAVTGDDKKISSQLQKQNKKERNTDLQGQLSLDEALDKERSHYIQTFKAVGAIAENSATDVRYKQMQYQQTRKHDSWWRDYSACNLWTAAFFMPLTEQNLKVLPTTASLSQLVRGKVSNTEAIETANKLAEEKRFFHWDLEFPGVFEAGGFDCVLGNPPWELLQIAEKEFFASRHAEIANAANKAAREKLIQQLQLKNPQLFQEFEITKYDSEAQNKFIRESERFVLTAVGKINTYAVFAETTRKLISPNGRAGIIVPTGIATDDTCKRFFGDVTQKQNLASLYDFENREAIFASVHRSYKFSLFVMSGKSVEETNLSFFLTQPKQLEDKERAFQLSPQDIALMNPNTLTCPVFRTKADAELTKKIYQRVPVLENETTGSNPWGISFMQGLFNMSSDSNLFRDRSSEGLVPLYEAKMFHQFDRAWATYEGTDTRNVSLEEKCDPNFSVTPRYWVNKSEVDNRLAGKWDREWLLAFRRICRSTDERTFIVSAISQVGFGDSVFLILPRINKPNLISSFCANLNSLVFDYVTQQKMGGTNLNFFIVKQLPIIPPEAYTKEDIEFISDRVLELVYTAWDMQPFAKDMGYEGEPFVWNEQRRAILRAELDAYYAKLYGLTRDELRYILNPSDIYGEEFPGETFRVLKNNEIKKYGEYRTQKLVLQAWDKMFG